MFDSRAFLKGAIGSKYYKRLKQFRYQLKQWLFFRQSTEEIKVGNYILKAPSSHLLCKLNRKQPLRDHFIGLTAREVVRKYPEASILDVGANIGDTAAMIASYTKAPMILIEPSEYYHSLLIENIKKLPISVRGVHQVLLSDKSSETGTLFHRRGTAAFDKSQDFGKRLICRRLIDVTDPDTRLIKIDTDGFDYRIIASSFRYLSEKKPCLIYENQVETKEQLDEAQSNLQVLIDAGYKRFMVWDDPGHFLLFTEDMSIMHQLNYYLYAQSCLDSQIVYNFDILAVSQEDCDVAARVVDAFGGIPTEIPG